MGDKVQAARSTWTGAISFGLVTVPVKLYLAAGSRDVSFNQLHADCEGRIRYPKRCEKCGEEVHQADIVKGFQFEKDQYVVFEEGELEQLQEAFGRTLEIVSFIPAEGIDQVMLEKPYYVEPDETGVKAYALLRDAMKAQNVVAVAKLGMREKTHLALLRLDEHDRFVVHTMFWPDEVRVPNFETPDVYVRKEELAMAKLLVENLTTDEVDWSQFEDTYRLGILSAAATKANKKPMKVKKRQPADVAGLQDALKASLQAIREKKEAGDEVVTEAAVG